MSFFFLSLLHPPRSKLTYTLFPYTKLFRSKILLPLAAGFLMSTPLASTSQALVNALRDRLEETVSVAALDDRDRQRIIYIARAEKNQVIAAPLMVGSTLPAHCTSMGRVLLAALPPMEGAAWVARSDTHTSEP